MEILDIASKLQSVVPDNVTPRAIEMELNPAQSLMRRSLHLGLVGIGYDSTQSGETAAFWVDVEFYKANSKLDTQRFAFLNGNAGNDPEEAGRHPCPPFFVLKTDEASGSYDPFDIALLSGRSPMLTGGMLMWNLLAFGSAGFATGSAVLFTAPIEFTADIDRVVVKTVPRSSQWIPCFVAGSGDPRLALAAAIVSKAL